MTAHRLHPTARRLLFAAAALLLSGTVAAQAARPSDIDIYAGGSGTIDRPNVLLILDSSANWSASLSSKTPCYYKNNGITTSEGPTADQGTKVAIEKCALHNMVDALPVKATGGADNDALFNVGFMLMNESPHDGGYPRQAFVPLTSNNKSLLKTMIKAFDSGADKASNADYGQALYEAYLWYKAMAPLNGTKGQKEDGNAFSGGRYVTPAGESCGRNYIILIGNGSPQNSNPEKSVKGLMATRIDADLSSWTEDARTALKAPIVNPALGNDEANWSDEMARFLRQVDVSGKLDTQGIITHAIAVKKGPSDGNFPALMNSVANYGGGSYFEATDADVLVSALLDIFNQIQAVNSVFASASLPVSVNARGTYLNQVYMGNFRPDGEGKPRWRGNLKQYKFALDGTNNLYLADSAGNAAVSASTGFIAPAAVSFWTTSSNFWANAPLGTPPSASDSPDGEVVEKGAVAQRLRTTYATSQTGRKVLTCVSCAHGTRLLGTGATAATLFDTANAAITSSDLGAADATERDNIINWVRGTNNAGDEAGPTTTPATTVRPSIHGDVLHSRPAVVNYGGSIGVVVFYGANDGQLRAVNGNQTGTGGGEELWSFVPQEQFGKLKRLRANDPEVLLCTEFESATSTRCSNTSTEAGGAQTRDFLVDGPIGVYQKFSGSTVERVIIYVGMRRGGRQIYALDVTVPDQPKMLWKLDGENTSGMSRLGQTWSEPRVARIKGHENPVVIFGGGYDQDAEDLGATLTMGNAIYVVDAIEGNLLREFTSLDGGSGSGSIGRSVPGDVTLVDYDYDGKVDRAYAADLGGQIYRIDFEMADGDDDPEDWTIYKVADLSGGTSTGRKLFFSPDVVQTREFTALLIGSGDREKPLLSATQDHFFQLFDRRTAKGAPATASPIVWADLVAAGTTSSTSGAGCYMALEQGEKVVNAATSIGGFSFFGTNRPSSSSASNVCSANLGVAKSYAMPLFCVASRGSVLAGGGLPPSPVAGIVTVPRADGTQVQVPFVIGAPNARNSGIEGSRLNPTIQAPRKRRYWYQETER